MTNLTIEDIAKKAGVSRATVSRVLNDFPYVREELKKRVLDVIEETGYQPNFAARSLASRRSHIIGLVIPQSVHTLFSDPYFSRLIEGISATCNQHKYTLSLFVMYTEEEEQWILPRISRHGITDGLIIQSARVDDPLVKKLVEQGVPSLLVGRTQGLEDVHFIDVDNVTGAFSAVEHLVRLGYTRIATISGPSDSTAGIDRLTGYRNALESFQYQVDERLICEGNFSEESGYQAARRLLPYMPEAVFVASDMMAIGAMRAIQESGLSVPEDIAIVGYDDLPPAAIANPPLTTIRQPIFRIGVMLVEQLVQMLGGSEIEKKTILPTELVVRESCGGKGRRSA